MNRVLKKIAAVLCALVLMSGCATINTAKERIIELFTTEPQTPSEAELEPMLHPRGSQRSIGLQSPQDTPARAVEGGEEDSRHLVHVVRWPGETLSLIAEWYTGRPSNWRALAEANPDIDPNRIFIGNKILIPVGLAVERKPLPSDYATGTSESELPELQPPPPDEEPLRLFGPKEYPSQ